MFKKIGIFILFFSFILPSKVKADLPKDMTGPMKREQKEYFVYGDSYRLGYTLCYLMMEDYDFGEIIKYKNLYYKMGLFYKNDKRLREISDAGFDEGVDAISGGNKFHKCYILK